MPVTEIGHKRGRDVMTVPFPRSLLHFPPVSSPLPLCRMGSCVARCHGVMLCVSSNVLEVLRDDSEVQVHFGAGRQVVMCTSCPIFKQDTGQQIQWGKRGDHTGLKLPKLNWTEKRLQANGSLTVYTVYRHKIDLSVSMTMMSKGCNQFCDYTSCLQCSFSNLI